MIRGLAAAVLLGTLALPAHAAAPEASPRPLPRATAPEAVVIAALPSSLRPEARPQNLRRKATVARVGTPDYAPSGVPGAVCGREAIRGVQIAAIPGRLSGCGIGNPVRVSMVEGVRLSQAAVMDCNTAQALAAWVRGIARPAIGATGGGLAGLRVAAHYSCRTRNNLPGAKVSEHGRGRAIDISAFLLANGAELSVLRDWSRGSSLRTIHRGACGPFATVLGPDADRFHQDHFHLDTARRSGGAYCR
ncbi:extensin-like domain-containing protein [Palleronia abyssalis]|uniref:Extensin-like C-terminal domain-containing protein n=1 Tax=Palleronia abyssalis TaxID=1501240 RepID=A0A2R8BXT5_9RHOB|nr:extensin family protein [Palleronia abyssalis]SPJ24959.1 hypothetical protein PAA8504_02801 [Palleronia abyssalis]